jgi:hypothetical protein
MRHGARNAQQYFYSYLFKLYVDGACITRAKVKDIREI